MSTDLMDRLRAVGQLNDEWSEPHVAADRPSLYAVEVDAPVVARRHRYAVPAAVAALTLVVVATTALITGGDRAADPAATTPAIQPTDEEWEADWTTDFPERLAGQMPDGTPWSVDIAADSVEVCFQVGSSSGCGVPRVQFVVIGTPGDHQLVYGLVNQGPYRVDTGERLRGPASVVELELTDGTIVPAAHVGERLWATILPAGTTLRDALTQRWDDGMSMRGIGDPGEVPELSEEERRAAEAAARRAAEAERQRMAELQRRAAEESRSLETSTEP
jgi:hypothetical protein